MTARELIEKYLSFFVKKGHKKLPNVSLIPENDPTTLFISAGMQPLIPYLLGEPHPLGKKLVSLQKCLRTGDVEEVGDVFHNTFFEMLGNWSLGDYWKEESLSWSLEFLTKILGLDPKRLHVTIFKGDKYAPRDNESEEIWLSLGIPKERIYPLPKEDNWWETGETGPGGPDSEIFYDLEKSACGPNCRPGDNCGRFFEMWNNVFMEYNRKPDGSYEKLKQKNVDTGMGVERTVAVLEGKDDIYQTELFNALIDQIKKISGKKYQGENKRPMRIMADHTKAAAFIIADGVIPSNVEQGYILRRLIRRAVDQAVRIGYTNYIRPLLEEVVNIYKTDYLELARQRNIIYEIFENEESKYSRTKKRAKNILVKIRDISAKAGIIKEISGKEAFRLFSTYGLSPQQLEEQGYEFNQEEFNREFKKHQQKSRASLEKKFSGGLADQSPEAIKLHTATHLLHAALRQLLGAHVQQKGSNITSERLRFDFSHPKKPTIRELKEIENLVNQKIRENLPVVMKMVSFDQARNQKALAFFGQRYGARVKVYSIGSFSKEVCGGPHVTSTGELGCVKIIKSEKIGGGISRVYATLEAAGK